MQVFYVIPWRLELQSMEPESTILSIELRDQIGDKNTTKNDNLKQKTHMQGKKTINHAFSIRFGKIAYILSNFLIFAAIF